MLSRALSPSDLSIINTSDASFELELHRRRAFYAHDDRKLPDDLSEVERALQSSQSDSKPSNKSLTAFRRRLRNCCNEAAVVQGVMPMLVPLDDLLDREDLITIPNQQWDKECSMPISTAAQHRVSPPKPDQTVGLAASSFARFETALAYLSHSARPVRSLPELTFPLITVEAKGDRGQNVCRSQSLHNAAVMLHQLLELWQITGKSEEFFGQTMVCTIAITTQTCAISQYWMESDQCGISVHGRQLRSWTLSLSDASQFSDIVESIKNIINFIVKRGQTLITERLRDLDQILSALATPSSKSCSTCSSSTSGSRRRRFVLLDDFETCRSSSVENTPSRKASRNRVAKTPRGRRRSSNSRSTSGSSTQSSLSSS